MNNEEIAQKLTELECKTESNTENIKILDHKVDDIHRIATSVELIAKDMTYIKADMAEVKNGQKNLQASQEVLQTKITDVENSSAKRKEKFLDNLSDKAWWLIIGGIIAGLLAMILPQIFG